MINRYKIVILWIFMVQLLHAAGFSSTDSLINVPFATSYEPNELQFGASLGYSGSSTIQDDDMSFEADYKIVYAFNDSNQLALTMVNPSDYVAHFQHTITDVTQMDKLAIGVRNITSAPFSTWSYNDDYVESVNMSPYIVQTFVRKNTSFSVGYGLQGFQHSVNTITGLGSIFESFNGLFWCYL